MAIALSFIKGLTCGEVGMAKLGHRVMFLESFPG